MVSLKGHTPTKDKISALREAGIQYGVAHH